MAHEESPPPATTDPPADGLLVAFVNMANGAIQLRAGITLTIGGFLVSGTLVGVLEYIDRLRGQVVEAMEEASEQRKGWEELFDAWRESIADGLRTDEETAPQFIHLVDARHHLPGSEPLPTGAPLVCWRGRIGDVDGWTLGELRPTPS